MLRSRKWAHGTWKDCDAKGGALSPEAKEEGGGHRSVENKAKAWSPATGGMAGGSRAASGALQVWGQQA